MKQLKSYQNVLRLSAKQTNGEVPTRTVEFHDKNALRQRKEIEILTIFYKWANEIGIKHGFHTVLGYKKYHTYIAYMHKADLNYLYGADTLLHLKWNNASELIKEIYGEKEEMFYYQALIAHAITKEALDDKITTMTFHDYLAEEWDKAVIFPFFSPESSLLDEKTCSDKSCDVCYHHGVYIGDYISKEILRI